MATHTKLSRWLERQSISRSAFAEQLNCSRSIVTRWCNGDRIPMRNAAVAIELHTAGAIRAAEWGYELKGSPGQKAIQRYLLKEGMSVNAAAKHIGVASMSLRSWFNGDAVPSEDSVERLSKGLRVKLTREDF